MTDEKMLDKVRKLLAKAEGASTSHEAEAYTAKATELMIAHAIDEAMLQAGNKSTDTIISRDIIIEGYAKAKMQLLYRVATAMGAKTIYTANTRNSGWAKIKVTVIGWESDVDSIQVLFSSLTMQVVTDMEREAKLNPYVHGRSFKQAFILGFANEVGNRLTAQRRNAVKVAEDSTPGAALAVVERSTAVENDFARRYPTTGKGTGPKASSYAGYGNGQAAGRRANIGQASVPGGRRALTS